MGENMMFTVEDLREVLEDNNTEIGHVLSRNAVRNPDYGKVEGAPYFLIDSNGNCQYTDWEPTEFDNDWCEVGDPIVIHGVQYDVKQLEQTGGMDEGSAASVTFSVGDRIFQKHGYYASHYGYDWDGDFYEVEAYEKTVTDYREI